MRSLDVPRVTFDRYDAVDSRRAPNPPATASNGARKGPKIDPERSNQIPDGSGAAGP